MQSHGRTLGGIVAMALACASPLAAQTVNAVNPTALTVTGGQSVQLTLFGTSLDAFRSLRVVIGGATVSGATPTFISTGSTQRRVSILTNTQLVSGTATLQALGASAWVTIPVSLTTVAAPNDAQIGITAFSVSPAAVYSTAAVTATMTTSSAPVAPMTVEIINDSSGAVVATGTVAPGATSLTIPLPSQPTGGKVLRARRPPYTTGPTATLVVHPLPQLLPYVSSVTFHAGQSKPILAQLSPAAALGGVLTVSSSSSALIVPSTVPVTPGQSQLGFTVGVGNVAQSSTGTITVAFGTSQQTLSYQLIGTSPTPIITAITPAADTVTGGNPVSFVVSLNSAVASAGLELKVTSSKPGIVIAPASVPLPNAATSAQVTVSTTPVSATTTALLTIQLGNTTSTATVTVRPPAIAGVTFTPPLVAGQPISSKVTLDALVAAPPGVTVTLTSPVPGVAQPPASVTVLPGAFEQSFVITTSADFPQTSKAVTILAQTIGSVKAATLVLQRQTGVVSSVSLTSGMVDGGTSLTGTVSLDKPSKAGGTTVGLTSDGPSASVPGSVIVPAGQTSQTFSVTTQTVSANTNVVIAASDGVDTASASLTVRPPAALQDLAAPYHVEGGQGVALTLSLNHSLQSGQTKSATLSSSHSSLQIPPSVTLQCCSASAQIQATTTAVAADQPVVVAATLDGVTVADTVLVRGLPTVAGLTINPDVVWTGQPSAATVSLNRSVLSPTTIALSSTNPSRVTMPSAVVVPAGASSTPVQIGTTVGSPIALALVASLNGTSVTDTISLLTPSITLQLAGHVSDTLSAFSTHSVTVGLGGRRAPGSLTLALSATPAGLITVPPSVTIPAGAYTNTSFSIAVGAVTTLTAVTLRASGNGVDLTKQLWLKP